MHYCNDCDKRFTNPRCPMCGRRPTREAPEAPGPEVARHSSFLSEVDARVETDEELVERVSRPSLASLIKRGLKAGLITPVQDYAQGKKQ